MPLGADELICEIHEPDSEKVGVKIPVLRGNQRTNVAFDIGWSRVQSFDADSKLFN